MNTQSGKKINSLNILYWNARSIKNRKHELPSLLQNIDIFICVESWLKDSDKSIFAKGFVQVKKNRQHATGGGILILIKKEIAFIELNNIISPDTSVELCAIRITNTNPVLDIHVCYRTPGFSLTQEQWNVLVKNVDQNRSCILVGDFNSHNTIWKCRYTDSNGNRLQTSIEDHNLVLHNHDKITRSDFNTNTHSNIDLFFLL